MFLRPRVFRAGVRSLRLSSLRVAGIPEPVGFLLGKFSAITSFQKHLCPMFSLLKMQVTCVSGLLVSHVALIPFRRFQPRSSSRGRGGGCGGVDSASPCSPGSLTPPQAVFTLLQTMQCPLQESVLGEASRFKAAPPRGPGLSSGSQPRASACGGCGGAASPARGLLSRPPPLAPASGPGCAPARVSASLPQGFLKQEWEEGS